MTAKKFLVTLFDRFSITQTTTLAASLAFYTSLSLAPLLVLFISITSKLDLEIQNTFIEQMKGLVGLDAAKTFEIIIQNAKQSSDLASFSGILSLLTLFFSASLIFGELRKALDKIFELTPKIQTNAKSGIQQLILQLREIIFHIALVLIFLFIMIVSVIMTSLLSLIVVSNRTIWLVFEFGLSIIIYSAIFSMLFRFLPISRINWAQAAKGGVITSLLFVIGKGIIGFYLGRHAIGSAYGAAGSVIVLLVWVYYSALITFIGAHVSSILIRRDYGLLNS